MHPAADVRRPRTRAIELSLAPTAFLLVATPHAAGNDEGSRALDVLAYAGAGLSFAVRMPRRYAVAQGCVSWMTPSEKLEQLLR